MKVDKLMCINQPSSWLQRITNECLAEYPIHLVDINQSELVIDLGCNVGGFSNAFKDRFKNIVAIDASLYNIEQYKKNHNHKTLHNAIHSEDGKILRLKKYMADGKDDTNSGNFSVVDFVSEINMHGFRGEEYEEVKTICLETLFKMFGSVGLLKIDVEGAEFESLYSKDLTFVKFITGEFHNFLGTEKLNKLFNWLEKTHKEIYSVGDGNVSHFIKMWVLK